jgi:hypothetical protein
MSSYGTGHANAGAGFRIRSKKPTKYVLLGKKRVIYPVSRFLLPLFDPWRQDDGNRSGKKVRFQGS